MLVLARVFCIAQLVKYVIFLHTSSHSINISDLFSQKGHDKLSINQTI